uniref:Uncharacterized protein n=1 Tax=Lynx canadensis TaxID=61383 RepID=A0A667J1E4_LYNCA
MGTAKNNHTVLKLPLLDKPKTQKNYAQPEVLCHTFETLSNLHKLLPNHMMETLYFYKREEDKQNCRNSEFSGLERILARHQFPKEINLTPNPSSMPLWRRKCINNANRGWKKCQLWNKSLEEPPMSTIVHCMYKNRRCVGLPWAIAFRVSRQTSSRAGLAFLGEGLDYRAMGLLCCMSQEAPAHP